MVTPSPADLQRDVLELAIARALPRSVGAEVDGATALPIAQWPAGDAAWAIVPLERPFSGRCWIAASHSGAARLVGRKWKDLRFDREGAAALFGDFLLGVIAQSLQDIGCNMPRGMTTEFSGVGACPCPTGMDDMLRLDLLGVSIFVAFEPAASLEFGPQCTLPAWSELARTA